MSEEIQHEPEETGIVLKLAHDDVERKKFLRMAGKTMGSAAAATGLATFIAACGSSKKKTTSPPAAAPSTSTSSTASSDPGDLKIVNYALTLEYLEDQFYSKVVATGLFSGSMLATLKTFGEEEAQHVAALKKVASELGTPVAEPTGKFPLTSAASIGSLAYTVENLGAAAYLGQAAAIKSPAILAAALSIHTVEARHASTLGYALKMSSTPDGAFGKPMTMAQVIKVVTPFIA